MNYRGYISSRPFLGERVPQSVQNLVIRDYCKRNKLNYLLSSVEYIPEGKYLILNGILKDLHNIDGIVAYSLLQLPKDTLQRKKIYEIIINNKKSIHFALEQIFIKTFWDICRVENIWMVRLTIDSCPKCTIPHYT